MLVCTVISNVQNIVTKTKRGEIQQEQKQERAHKYRSTHKNTEHQRRQQDKGTVTQAAIAQEGSGRNKTKVA
jgi:hypothetical protein